MHADPLDRIGPATLAPVATDDGLTISVAALFAQAITLPFTHPRRWLACGFIPCCILAGEIYVLYRSLVAWNSEPSPNLAEIDPTIADTSNPGALLALTLGWLLMLFCAVAFWFCAWQRDTARHFVDPIGKLLWRSLARLPGYLPAFAIWVIAPAAIVFALEAIVIQSGLGSLAGLDDITLLPQLSPERLWLTLAGCLVAPLPGLWLSARISPLPALVAARGWRDALGDAWRLSEGHGIGIALSFFLSGVLGGLLSMLGLVATLMAFRPWHPGETFLIFAVWMASFVCALITQFWCGSLAALAVRESVGACAEIDPATFD
jgi:hypothetical protein